MEDLATEFTIEGHELRRFGVWDELGSWGAGQAEVPGSLWTLQFFLGPKKPRKLSAVILEPLRFLDMSLEGLLAFFLPFLFSRDS